MDDLITHMLTYCYKHKDTPIFIDINDKLLSYYLGEKYIHELRSNEVITPRYINGRIVINNNDKSEFIKNEYYDNMFNKLVEPLIPKLTTSIGGLKYKLPYLAIHSPYYKTPLLLLLYSSDLNGYNNFTIRNGYYIKEYIGDDIFYIFK